MSVPLGGSSLWRDTAAGVPESLSSTTQRKRPSITSEANRENTDRSPSRLPLVPLRRIFCCRQAWPPGLRISSSSTLTTSATQTSGRSAQCQTAPPPLTAGHRKAGGSPASTPLPSARPLALQKSRMMLPQPGINLQGKGIGLNEKILGLCAGYHVGFLIEKIVPLSAAGIEEGRNLGE